MRRLTVGILGGGTVGSGVLSLLHRHRDTLEAMGVELGLTPVLVRDPAKPRATEHPGARFTSDADELESADLLIEVMGGVDPALERILPALEAGQIVVTANKAVLAERWEVLRPFAERGQLFYEAAVMAGTPVIGPLATTLRSSGPLELHAVLSGTCNYILSRMEAGAGYGEALAEAQAKGYAEDPPTLDVGGFDAAHKLAVLARLAFDPAFPFSAVEVRGIEGLSSEAVLEAVGRGEQVKLVGSVVPDGPRWRAIVRPVVLDGAHPLATSHSSRNALLYSGDACGEVFFSGGGAGGLITASAVVGDLLAYLAGHPGHAPRLRAARPPLGYEPAALEEVSA